VSSQMFANMVTAHSLNLLRFEKSVRREALKTLKELEKDLVKELTRLDPTAVGYDSYKKARLERLLQQTRLTISSRMKEAASAMNKSLYGMARVETDFVKKAIAKSIGVDLSTVGLSSSQLRAILSDTVIQGAASGQWWSKIGKDLQSRFSSGIRQGMLRGETLGQLVTRIRGTKEKSFKDGIMSTTASSARRLIRTSVQAVANKARDDTYLENDDLIRSVQWVATLDGRTTKICRARDGKRYSLPDHEPIGHSLPWLEGPGAIHWQCRSTSVAILKSWKELSGKSIRTGGRPSDIESMMGRRLAEMGMDEDQREAVMYRSRASMRGYVDREMDYDGWLRRMPLRFQERVMGDDFDLWKRRKLTLAEAIDSGASPLDVEMLAEEAENLDLFVDGLPGTLPQAIEERGLRGATTGMTKPRFIAMLFEKNKRWRLSDGELQDMLDAEFPDSIRYGIEGLRQKYLDGQFGSS
jgi:SPP1 gp7 family putative phage head morphogenesis protein